MFRNEPNWSCFDSYPQYKRILLYESVIKELVRNDGLNLGSPCFTEDEKAAFEQAMGPEWIKEQYCPRRESQGYKQVGETCICGKHYKVCAGCRTWYLTWENPHYVPSIGHYTDPGDTIEPYFTCVKDREFPVGWTSEDQ